MKPSSSPKILVPVLAAAIAAFAAPGCKRTESKSRNSAVDCAQVRAAGDLPTYEEPECVEPDVEDENLYSSFEISRAVINPAKCLASKRAINVLRHEFARQCECLSPAARPRFQASLDDLVKQRKEHCGNK